MLSTTTAMKPGGCSHFFHFPDVSWYLSWAMVVSGIITLVVDRGLIHHRSPIHWWLYVFYAVVVDFLATIVSHRLIWKANNYPLELSHLFLSVGRFIWTWILYFTVSYDQYHTVIKYHPGIALMWAVGGSLVTLQVVFNPIMWICRKRRCCGMGGYSGTQVPLYQPGTNQLYGDPLIDGDSNV
jgi:hypothetical protein